MDWIKEKNNRMGFKNPLGQFSVQKTRNINNASEGYVEGFHGNSYISLGLLYAVSAIFNWLAPTIMIILGLKYTMFIGALCYAAYIATFFYLSDYLLYCGSAVIGFGADGTSKKLKSKINSTVH